ncbi:glycosyltransferase [Mongoliitalea daihaiensis]|uniref:glycosyltransferase n=1 Tax=Mongoliitalea daihaiensis TaxID=2782006 RepID=UPI001F3C2A4D|nr:glycosyltransferase [Mongoliitalea daihaiensis]UJP64169.1 glycosyltransferase [Mongoliitalea daihaiensis]
MNKIPILYISQSGPYPPNDGKKQRSLALLKALEQNYQVDYLIIDHDSDYHIALQNNKNPNTRFLKIHTTKSLLKTLFKKIGLIFLQDKGVRQYIHQLYLENNYQFVFSRYIHPVCFIPADLKIIADIDDDFLELYRSRISQAQSAYRIFRLVQILFLNKCSYQKLKAKVDLPILVKKEKGFLNYLMLPNLPFQLLLNSSIQFVPFTNPSLLFVGKLTYEPNLHGIQWFIKNVYPSLLEKFPNLPMTLVSPIDIQDQELEQMMNNHPAIKKLVDVPNIQSTYHTHSVVIAPIFQGAGSNLKVIEALLMGRPVVTTSFGTKGVEIEIDAIKVANETKTFSAALLDLLQSNNLSEFQKLIFENSKKKYTFENWTLVLNSELTKIL